MSIFKKKDKVPEKDFNDPMFCRQEIACMNQVDVMRCVLVNRSLVATVKEWITWLESLYTILPDLKTGEREKKLESLRKLVDYAEGRRDFYL